MTTIQDGGVSPGLLESMNGTKSGTKSVAAEAQDRYMTLLVTQMKNQDPLNPLDNAQVTSQLAQLSTVTGIDKLNDSIGALMSSYQASQSMQAASMIGHGVLVPGSDINLAEGQALMGVELTQPVDNVKLTIFDASGREVRKLDLGPQQPGTLPVAWDGTTADGSKAADGVYTFKLAANLGSESVTATALQFGLVTSVATNAQGVKLSLPGMGDVKFSDVRQIL
jgi:flagellar basal-body rod modification protein FlgD